MCVRYVLEPDPFLHVHVRPTDEYRVPAQDSSLLLLYSAQLQNRNRCWSFLRIRELHQVDTVIADHDEVAEKSPLPSNEQRRRSCEYSDSPFAERIGEDGKGPKTSDVEMRRGEGTCSEGHG